MQCFRFGVFRKRLDKPENSCGREIATTRVRRSKHVWYPCGPALEKFEGDINIDIQTSLRNICQSHTDIYVRLYMIGSRCETARPIIMVCCTNTLGRKEAEDLLRASEIPQKYPEFGIGGSAFPLEHSQPARALGSDKHDGSEQISPIPQHGAKNDGKDKSMNRDKLNMSHSRQSTVMSTSREPVIGRQLFATTSGTPTRSATGGVVVCIGDRYYQMTAGHIDEPQEPEIAVESNDCHFDGQSDDDDDYLGVDETDADITSRASDSLVLAHSHSFTSSTDDLGRSSGSSFLDGSVPDRHSRPVSPITSTFSKVLENGRNGSEPRVSNSITASTNSLVYVGDIVHHSRDGDNPFFDYALLSQDQPSMDGINMIRLDDRSGARKLFIETVEPVGIVEREVIVVTASGGVTRGIQLAGSTTVYHAARRSFHKLHSIQLQSALKPGDSGGAILDQQTGGYLGHIVKGCEDAHVAYFVAAADVFDDLKSRFGDVSLAHDIAPSAGLSLDTYGPTDTASIPNVISNDSKAVSSKKKRKMRSAREKPMPTVFQKGGSAVPTMGGLLVSPSLASQSDYHHDIQRLERVGINGDRTKKASFVPFHALKAYWSPDRLEVVLSLLSPAPSIKAVRDRYLRVFTILVLLDEIELLESFTSYGLEDTHWPRVEPFPQWPATTEFAQFFDEFKHHQWKYFPLDLDEDELIDRKLSPNHILPFESVRALQPHILRSSDAASTFLVTVRGPPGDSSNDRPNGSIEKSFVLKTYDFGRNGNILGKKAYQDGLEVYSSVKFTGHSEYVVNFYGSFQQGETGNLLLEYVSGGTLQDYWNRTTCPRRPDDIHDFWSSMSGLLRGLEKVDQINGTRRREVHPDLKPDNILVFLGAKTSPYRFVPKLADFGLQIEQNRNVDIRKWAHPAATLHRLSMQVDGSTSSHNMWSLGCIYIAAAIWLSWDPIRFHRARNLLQPEDNLGLVQLLKSIQDGRYDLRVLDPLDFLKNLDLFSKQSETKACQDDITPQIMEVVRKEMLNSDALLRLSARHIETMISSVLHDGKRSQDLANRVRRSISQRAQILTIDQCVAIHKDTRSGRRPNDGATNKIRELKSNLSARDYIFLIDDSFSMSQHLKDVLRVFTALSYIADYLDEDKLELAFLSSPSKVHRRNTVKLTDLVSGHHFDRIHVMTQEELGKFLEHAVVSKLPGRYTRHISVRKQAATVFVFTDGCWGKDFVSTAGVPNPIAKLKEAMSRRKIDKNNLAIQFIRFGDDADATRNLEYLADMGQKEGL